MFILARGKADTQSDIVRLYRTMEGDHSIQVAGNFGGASVQVQISLDAEHWENLPDFEMVTEPKIGSLRSLNGWIRAKVNGGTPFKVGTNRISWTPGVFYDKGAKRFDNQSNRYLECTESHLDSSCPNMQYWKEIEVPADENFDNSEATLIDVIVN